MARDFSSGNNLLVGNPAELQFNSSELTISFFMWPDAYNGIICAKRDSGLASIGFWVVIQGAGFSNRLEFGIGNNSSTYEEAHTASPPSLTGPTHVVCRKLGSAGDAIRLYLGGSLDSTGSSTSNVVSAVSSFRIGRSDQGLPFYGRIWELAIWDKGLISEEIAALAAGFSPLLFRRDHLKGYWPILGLADPEVDLSGFGNNAALVGTPGVADHLGIQPLPWAA